MASKRKGKGKGGKYKAAATLVIHGPGKMTAAGRKDIADWLRGNAVLLTKNHLTTGQFRGRYMHAA
jgi:hypothetical protein